jgi:PEP-CTERM motif
MNRLTVVLCGLVLAALLTTSAWADTVYTYTGNPFTSNGNPLLYSYSYPPFTPSDSVTGSFTLASPLEANLPILGPDGFTTVTPTSFSFTDGVNTLSNTDSFEYLTLDVGTDATGAINQWIISLQTYNNVLIYTEDWVSRDDQGWDGQPGVIGDIRGNPGTWTSSTTDPSPATTPEPSSIALLGTGILGLVGTVRRKLAR